MPAAYTHHFSRIYGGLIIVQTLEKCIGGEERFIEYQDEENGALLAVALLTWIFQCAITIITGKPELGTRGQREQRMY